MEITKSNYELQKFLKLRLAEMQAKNPLYSMRALAKSMDVPPAALSEFLNGKRQFSPKLQRKILNSLNLSPDIKEKLIKNIEASSNEPASTERIQIDTDSYYIISDPLYYSLLCLIETKDFIKDTYWMSLRLKRPENEISLALERLERIGYIKRNSEGHMIVADAHLMTTDDVANMSLRLRHAENLDNAKDALLNLPVSERYFRFETLPIGLEQMPEFKQAAQEFLDKILAISKKGQKDEVYEFCLNFFPRSTKHKDS